MTVYFEHGNKILSWIKLGEIVYSLWDCWLLKKTLLYGVIAGLRHATVRYTFIPTLVITSGSSLW
jgi:hypothetical protein